MGPDRASLRALLAAATGLPWRWAGNVDTGDVRLAGRARRSAFDRQPDGSYWSDGSYATEVFDVAGEERKPDDRGTHDYANYLREYVQMPDGAGGYRPMTEEEIAEDVRTNWLEDHWGEPRQDNRLRFYQPHPGGYRPARDLAVFEVARNRGLPDDTPRSDERIYRADVVDVRNPNARLIRDGINALPALLDALDAAEGALERVRDVIEAGRPNPTSDVYEMGYRAGLEAIAAVLPSTKTATTS